MRSKRRVSFYIDGFNFYYGLKRHKIAFPEWKKYYWIDFVKLCEQFISPEQEVVKVYYFTASPLSVSKSNRQGALLNANCILNPERFEVVRGKYLEKHIECIYCHGDISHPEEKKTDVNISINMIKDCVKGATDDVVLVSADSDLIPPLELIRELYPDVGLKVIFPPANYSHDINNTFVSWRKKVVLMKNFQNRFDRAVMSDEVSDGIKTIQIPEKWKV